MSHESDHTNRAELALDHAERFTKLAKDHRAEPHKRLTDAAMAWHYAELSNLEAYHARGSALGPTELQLKASNAATEAGRLHYQTIREVLAKVALDAAVEAVNEACEAMRKAEGNEP